jgi:hypothetical protein
LNKNIFAIKKNSIGILFYLLKANFSLFNLSLSINFFSKEKLVAQPHLHFTFGEINKYLSHLECSEVSVFVNIFAQSRYASSFF